MLHASWQPPLPHRLERGVASAWPVQRHWHSFSASTCTQRYCTCVWPIFSGCYRL